MASLGFTGTIPVLGNHISAASAAGRVESAKSTDATSYSYRRIQIPEHGRRSIEEASARRPFYSTFT